jgi:hypothetical protein
MRAAPTKRTVLVQEAVRGRSTVKDVWTISIGTVRQLSSGLALDAGCAMVAYNEGGAMNMRMSI